MEPGGVPETAVSKGWIGVDLDGTLAEYDRWRGETHIGAPILRMVRRVKRWRTMGIEVRIFTARVGGEQRDLPTIRGAIERWCWEHLGEKLPVTCVKDYSMLELWDDRAVQVEPNSGRILGRRTRKL